MDVTLICFSQTGNTRQVATAMAGAFQQAGHSTRTLSLKQATHEAATRGDLLGVGTPCIASQAPTPIKEFLRALPWLDGLPAFVFATSSGAPGRVLYDLTRLLRHRGAQVLGGFLCRGQVHHPAPHMTGRFPGRPNAEDLARAQRFAAALVERLSAGRSGPLPENRPGTPQPGWGFYRLVGAAGSDRLLRALMPEPRLDPARCDRCRWCVDECPTDNISLGRLPSEPSYPSLGARCIRCYRCLTGCPRQAFSADWRLADPFLLLLYNRAFLRWFGDLEPGERICGI
jgi:ferredoxin/flavodoxin